MMVSSEHVTNIVLFYIIDYDTIHDHNISLLLSMVEATLLGDKLNINENLKEK
jgi:hypothetical protein